MIKADDTDSKLHSILCIWQDSRNGGNHHVLLPQCWLITSVLSLGAGIGNYIFLQASLLMLNSKTLVNKFRTLHEIRMFFTVSTTARQWSLS